MEDDELEIDASNVFCAADAFMAVFGLRRGNDITSKITSKVTETVEPLASEDQDEGHEF